MHRVAAPRLIQRRRAGGIHAHRVCACLLIWLRHVSALVLVSRRTVASLPCGPAVLWRPTTIQPHPEFRPARIGARLHLLALVHRDRSPERGMSAVRWFAMRGGVPVVAFSARVLGGHSHDAQQAHPVPSQGFLEPRRTDIPRVGVVTRRINGRRTRFGNRTRDRRRCGRIRGQGPWIGRWSNNG